MNGEPMIANPRWAELDAAVTAARLAAGRVSTMFDAAVRQVEAGAWDGGEADGFQADLAGHDAGAGSSADRAVEEIEAVRDSTPEEIPADGPV